jgi:hypothetical protein
MVEAPTTLKNDLPGKIEGGQWRNEAERESPSGRAFAPASQDAGSWRGNIAGEFLKRAGDKHSFVDWCEATSIAVSAGRFLPDYDAGAVRDHGSNVESLEVWKEFVHRLSRARVEDDRRLLTPMLRCVMPRPRRNSLGVCPVQRRKARTKWLGSA